MAGADCAKFQMRDMTGFIAMLVTAMTCPPILGTQYTLDLLERFQLKDEELIPLFRLRRQ